MSETDPDARIMKQSGGGFAPSYNVQLSVDAAHDIIVNVDVSQSGTDHGELTGSVRKVEERTGIKPAQVVADTGYTNHANILSMSDAKIDFLDHSRINQGWLMRLMNGEASRPNFAMRPSIMTRLRTSMRVRPAMIFTMPTRTPAAPGSFNTHMKPKPESARRVRI